MIYIAMHRLKAIIFDKDDTIIKDQVYKPSFDLDLLFDDVIPSCKIFKEHGYHLFIISNQSGISKGNFQEKILIENFIKFNKQLRQKYNFCFDGFFFCPHHPSSNCICRKPNDGLFIRLKAFFQIDISKSFYIGDRLTDIYFAKNNGICPVIIHRDWYQYKDERIYKDLEEIEILEEEGKVGVFNSLNDFAKIIEKLYI